MIIRIDSSPLESVLSSFSHKQFWNCHYFQYNEISIWRCSISSVAQHNTTSVTLVRILLFRASLSAEHSHDKNRQGGRTLGIKFQTMNKFTQSNWTRESTNMLQSLFAARFLIISPATRLRRFSLACQVTPRSDDNEIAPPTSCKFGILQLTF